MQQAEDIYNQVLRVDKNNADALHLLGVMALRAGKNEEAIEFIEKAIALKPMAASFYTNAGEAYRALNKLDEAIARYKRALSLNPKVPEAHNNLGLALQGKGQLEEATACYRRALSLKPDFHLAHNNLGNALNAQGRLEESIACYRRALSLKPDFNEAHSNLLLALQYQSGVNNAYLKLWHEEFGARLFGRALYNRQSHLNSCDPDRPLRLGFVSSDLNRHPVSFFVVSVFENIDPGEMEVICYSNSNREDEMTARIRSTARIWRRVIGLPDEALAQLIHGDAIDILFDLGGHTSNNRLPVFAFRPSPVQISWIGYAGTTGLSAIDYLMSDNVCIPEGEEVYFTEKIIRLPDGFLCYAPHGYAPQIGPPPVLTRGFITFGCFNNLAKINDEVISVWCELLRKMPASRLVLKNRSLSDNPTMKYYRDLFCTHGIDPQQIDFLPSSPHDQYLAAFNEIDISLDPFPFSGGTTSCDSLWMGVPVVTLYGQTALGRQGASINAQLGLQYLTAKTKEEYLDIALKTASDLEMLSRLRSNLRCSMEKSSLCDGKRFTRMWTQAVRDVWRMWCQTGS